MHITLKIYSVLVLLIAWVVLSFVFSPQILPGPIPVFQAIWENLTSGDGFFHLYKTIFRVLLGLAIAMIIGSAFGIVMGISPKGEKFLESWGMGGLTLPGGGAAAI